MIRHMVLMGLAFVLATSGAATGAATVAEPAKLLRQPDISATQIAFAYGGEIWIVPRSGGEARRLTSTESAEGDPRFSPDGTMIAYTGLTDDNGDVYVIAAAGGEPRRLTWHPGNDRVRGWSPDGRRVIFGTSRETAPGGYTRLYAVGLEGGPAEPLAPPRAFAADYSPDGKQIAYAEHAMAIADDLDGISQWRNYRGGRVSPIRIFDLADHSVRRLPWSNSNDSDPMWVGDTIYFLSDRDLAVNLHAFNLATGAVRQITRYRDFDIKTASAGAGAIVYEQAGYLHVYDTVSSEDHAIDISVKGDLPWTRPQWIDIGEQLDHGSLSPTGARALFEARGEILTVPAEKGDWRMLTNSPGAADRDPVWSPDGSRIAWFSDVSGEYRLMIQDQKGADPAREIPLPHPTFAYTPAWSPDGKHLAFSDTDLNLWLVEVETGNTKQIDHDTYTHPARTLDPVWSPDSRWIAYARRQSNMFHVISVYSIDENRATTITDGLSDSFSPAWDKDGKYLYFLAGTDFGLNSGWVDMSSFDRPVRCAVYLAVLPAGVPSPLLPESDEEPGEAAGETDKKKEKDGRKKADAADEKPEIHVTIDFAGLDQRILAFDLPPGDYRKLSSGSAGVFYYTEQVPGAPDLTLHQYTLDEREEKTFLEGIDRFALSADGEKLLYHAEEKWGIVKTSESSETGDGSLATGTIRILVDPRAEWRQIYNEAWRLHRDFFYDRGMNGADWNGIKDKYLPLLDHVAHRSDLSYLLATMAGELSVGHSFVFPPENPAAEERPRTGLLGADLAVDQGRYRIARIYTGENWNPGLRAPLSAPGVDVKVGDYILAVNGIELEASTEPYSLFTGTADRQTVLRVNNRSTTDGSRIVTVVPVKSDESLRTRAWVEANRRKVDELSGGRLAYVYLPNTGQEGYEYFNRYYFSQQQKDGVILDERFNGGGSVADYMVDIMARRLRGFFSNPADPNRPFTVPGAGIFGPKVMIIDESAGSGGDFLPWLFRSMQIGPLVGTRTWGGLVGIWDFPPLIDGGVITVPRGGFYNPAGAWEVENTGIAPDIEVEQTPREVIAGHDPQLERAVAEAMKLLAAESINRAIPTPPSPNRVLRPVP